MMGIEQQGGNGIIPQNNINSFQRMKNSYVQEKQPQMKSKQGVYYFVLFKKNLNASEPKQGVYYCLRKI